MLDKDELLHWCQRLNLSQETRNVIEQVAVKPGCDSLGKAQTFQ